MAIRVYFFAGLLAAAGGTHCQVYSSTLASAQSLLDAGKLSNAEQAVRRYLDSHKDSPEAHYLLGFILFKAQKPRPSLAEYTEGAKFRKPTARDLQIVGCDYVLLEDYADAAKWFAKSVEWDPANALTTYYLGRAKYNESRFEEAIEAFTRCLELDPRNVKAADNLGLSYEALGRTEDALAAYQNALTWDRSANHRNYGPYLDLGTLLVASDRTSEALPYLLEAVQIAPDEVGIHRQLGKAYVRLNELEKAQSELEKAVGLAPENAAAHFILSQIYRKRGLAGKAQIEGERYAALSAAAGSAGKHPE